MTEREDDTREKQRQQIERGLKMAKLLYLVCFLIVASFANLLFLFEGGVVNAGLVGMSASDVKTTVIFFGGVSIIALVLGFYLSRRIRDSEPARKLLVVSLVRVGSFMVPAAGGLVIGILGATAPIVMLFMVVPAIALLVTFPTKNSWWKIP